jgi:hypothetical protein
VQSSGLPAALSSTWQEPQLLLISFATSTPSPVVVEICSSLAPTRCMYTRTWWLKVVWSTRRSLVLSQLHTSHREITELARCWPCHVWENLPCLQARRQCHTDE